MYSAVHVLQNPKCNLSALCCPTRTHLCLIVDTVEMWQEMWTERERERHNATAGSIMCFKHKAARVAGFNQTIMAIIVIVSYS